MIVNEQGAAHGALGGFGLSTYRLVMLHGFNPTRRNRNIRTAKSGHGQDNRFSIPEVAHGKHAYWERIEDARKIGRVISGRVFKIFVQPTRRDCVYACTVDDITRLMSHVPVSDCAGLGAIVLRQPRRKEQTLVPVWGRLSHAADLVDRRGKLLYRGPAIVIEAINLTEPVKFGKGLSTEGVAELERLKSEGHKVRSNHGNYIVESTLESCRATQLYRTLLHELGHWVDFLEKVERPSAVLSDSGGYEELLERFHSRPVREKEEFAHSYASALSNSLRARHAIPFERQLYTEKLAADGLRLEDFRSLE